MRHSLAVPLPPSLPLLRGGGIATKSPPLRVSSLLRGVAGKENVSGRFAA